MSINDNLIQYGIGTPEVMENLLADAIEYEERQEVIAQLNENGRVEIPE